MPLSEALQNVQLSLKEVLKLSITKKTFTTQDTAVENLCENLRILLDDGLQLGVTFSDVVSRTDFKTLVEKNDNNTLAIIQELLNNNQLSELVENIHNLSPSLLRQFYEPHLDTLFFNEDKFIIFKNVIIPLQNMNFEIEVTLARKKKVKKKKKEPVTPRNQMAGPMLLRIVNDGNHNYSDSDSDNEPDEVVVVRKTKKKSTKPKKKKAAVVDLDYPKDDEEKVEDSTIEPKHEIKLPVAHLKESVRHESPASPSVMREIIGASVQVEEQKPTKPEETPQEKVHRQNGEIDLNDILAEYAANEQNGILDAQSDEASPRKEDLPDDLDMSDDEVPVFKAKTPSVEKPVVNVVEVETSPRKVTPIEKPVEKVSPRKQDIQIPTDDNLSEDEVPVVKTTPTAEKRAQSVEKPSPRRVEIQIPEDSSDDEVQVVKATAPTEKPIESVQVAPDEPVVVNEPVTEQEEAKNVVEEPVSTQHDSTEIPLTIEDPHNNISQDAITDILTSSPSQVEEYEKVEEHKQESPKEELTDEAVDEDEVKLLDDLLHDEANIEDETTDLASILSEPEPSDDNVIAELMHSLSWKDTPMIHKVKELNVEEPSPIKPTSPRSPPIQVNSPLSDEQPEGHRSQNSTIDTSTFDMSVEIPEEKEDDELSLTFDDVESPKPTVLEQPKASITIKVTQPKEPPVPTEIFRDELSPQSRIDSSVDLSVSDEGFELEEDAEELEIEYHADKLQRHARIQRLGKLNEIIDAQHVGRLLDNFMKYKMNKETREILAFQKARIENLSKRGGKLTNEPEPQFNRISTLITSLNKKEKRLKQQSSELKKREEQIVQKEKELIKLEQLLAAKQNMINERLSSPRESLTEPRGTPTRNISLNEFGSISSYPSNTSLDGLGSSDSVIVRMIDERGAMTPSPSRPYPDTGSESSGISNNQGFYLENGNGDDTDEEEERMQSTISALIRTPSALFTSSPVKGYPTSPNTNNAHMKLILTEDDEITNSKEQKLDQKEQTDAQNGNCAGCDRQLKLDYGWIRRPRYCHYTNKYYCMNCMNNSDKMPIPAKILSRWDSSPYHVCATAYTYLKEIVDTPMICVSAVNPLLFESTPNLKKARLIRKRLNLQWDIIEDCPLKDGLIQNLHLGKKLYYVNDTETYSLNNLIHLHGDAPFLKRLVHIYHEFDDHITKYCTLCKHKGQHKCQAPKCEHKSEPIYKYNITGTIVCPTCKLTYHKKCFKNESGIQVCPNCSS